MTVIARNASRTVTVISDKAASAIAPLPLHAFKGKGASVRTAALAGIASLAYIEGKSRTDIIDQARLTLGKAPTPADIAAVALEYVVGRVAQRLGRNKLSVADQLKFARQLVMQYAAPAKDGIKAKALRKGQIGRRSPEEHKIVRAAEGAWYLVNAELGFGTSQTQADKNKRQAAAPGATKRGKASQLVPSHSELKDNSASTPKSADDACKMVLQLAASLLAYSNKHAALLPATHGAAIKRFHAAIAQLEKDRPASDALPF